MRRTRSVVLVLALAAAAVLGGAASASAQAVACPATFHVLHNDRIGDLSLPQGHYRISTEGITCARASHLFTEFLEDYDGKLHKPWRYTIDGVGSGTFSGRGVFTVARLAPGTAPVPGNGTQGGGSHGDLLCAGTFTVENNDRIGRLRIPAGDYTITLLGGNLTCATAERYFGIFLERPSGKLPRKWVVLPRLAEFMKFSSHHGFRIKPAV
jgi:hypothetical protein